MIVCAIAFSVLSAGDVNGSRFLAASVPVVAHADLIGALTAPNQSRTYVIISTTDGQVRDLATYPGQHSLGPITLGSDGRYYALSSDFEVERVDPFNGDSEVLHGFGDTWPTPAQVSRDGVVYTGYVRYGQFWLAGWDIINDEWTDGIVPQDQFIVHTAHFRTDGMLVATQWGDNRIYTLDPDTGVMAPFGLLEPTESHILEFAHDGGRDYMITDDIFGQLRLFEIDLYTLERTFIAEMPEDLFGIAGYTCPADFNEDGALTILDFVAFQQAWQSQDPAADVNGDGVFDVLDFVAFQSLFLEGCP